MTTLARALKSHQGKLTDEQAAGILGVSVGAYRKYVRGARTPPRRAEVVTMEDIEERIPMLDRAQP
jgi:predicted transcriptional regulator